MGYLRNASYIGKLLKPNGNWVDILLIPSIAMGRINLLQEIIDKYTDGTFKHEDTGIRLGIVEGPNDFIFRQRRRFSSSYHHNLIFPLVAVR